MREFIFWVAQACGRVPGAMATLHVVLGKQKQLLSGHALVTRRMTTLKLALLSRLQSRVAMAPETVTKNRHHTLSATLIRTFGSPAGTFLYHEARSLP